MLPFLRISLRLALVFGMIVLAARLVGATRPGSPLAAVFSSPDGTACETPCVFGIRPGETSVDQAKLLLQSHPLIRNAEWINDNTLRLNGSDTTVTFSKTRAGMIETIALTTTRGDNGSAAVAGSLLDSIRLGDYMLTYGTTEINFPASEYVVFLHPDGGTFASIVWPEDFSQRVDPSTPLAHLSVSVVTPCYINQDYAAGGPWTGFTTIARYYAQRTFVSTIPSFQSARSPVRACQN